MTKLNTGLARKPLVFASATLIAILIISAACRGEVEETTPPPLLLPAPPPDELVTTLVPNTQLDLYVYIKQDHPINLPAGTISLPQDIEVEALAIWGVSAQEDLIFGTGIILASASEASSVYERIPSEDNEWKKLLGNTIYLVSGSGAAAESLKAIISNNDFKHYDNQTALKAVSTLPNGEITRLSGVAIAQPTQAAMNWLTKGVPSEELELINMVIQVADLEVIVSGFYSPDQIEIARIIETMEEEEGNLFQLDLSMVILLKSSLPDFLVESVTKNVLVEFGYTEVPAGEVTMYKGLWDVSEEEAIPILLRVEGNHIFVAVSAEESYATALLSSIRM